MNSKLVRIPGAFALYAPGSGIVHGTAGLGIGEAARRLRDREANREAFPGERVIPVYVDVRLTPDGGVSGFVHTGPVKGGAR